MHATEVVPATRDRPEISIRSAQLEDCKVLHRIINAAYRTHGGWTTEASMVKGERITIAELERLIQAGVDPILVAESVVTNNGSQSKEVVGCISAEHYKAHPQLSLPTGSALIGLFAVDPTMQSRGVGRRLFDSILTWVMDNWKDTNSAILWVLEGRGEIMGWYQRLGFQPTGQSKPFVMPDNLLTPGAQFAILAKQLTK